MSQGDREPPRRNRRTGLEPDSPVNSACDLAIEVMVCKRIWWEPRSISIAMADEI